MDSIYCCTECGANLNLSSTHLFPPDFYFEAGNKGTLSFSSIDSTKFRLEKEDKLRPFFETVNYWGIQRKRTKIKCNGCGHLVGYVYDDGPPLTDSPGWKRFILHLINVKKQGCKSRERAGIDSEFQILQGDMIHRKETHCCAIIGRHISDGGSVC